MAKPPRLPTRWSEFLAKQPETGMTYQIVDITLQGGRVVRDVAIIQSELIGEVRGHSDIPFDPADITGIEVTHRKWDFEGELRRDATVNHLTRRCS